MRLPTTTNPPSLDKLSPDASDHRLQRKASKSNDEPGLSRLTQLWGFSKLEDGTCGWLTCASAVSEAQRTYDLRFNCCVLIRNPKELDWGRALQECLHEAGALLSNIKRTTTGHSIPRVWTATSPDLQLILQVYGAGNDQFAPSSAMFLTPFFPYPGGLVDKHFLAISNLEMTVHPISRVLLCFDLNLKSSEWQTLVQPENWPVA